MSLHDLFPALGGSQLHPWLPLAVGLSVGLVALALGIRTVRRRKQILLSPQGDDLKAQDSHDPLVQEDEADNRLARRRRVQPDAVLLTEAGCRGAPWKGY